MHGDIIARIPWLTHQIHLPKIMRFARNTLGSLFFYSDWVRFAHPLNLVLSVCHDYSIVALFFFFYRTVINDASMYFAFTTSQWQTQIEPIASETDEDIMGMRKRLITFPTMKQKLIDWVKSPLFPPRT